MPSIRYNRWEAVAAASVVELKRAIAVINRFRV